MMGVVRYFIGKARIELTGASIEGFLNAMTKQGIAFWCIERKDELHFSICVAPKDIPQAQKIAIGCFCNIEKVKSSGFREHLKSLKKRPALLIGMLLAIVASFYIQSYVLAIDISGNATLHDEEILRALAEHDIQIGSSASDIDQQLTKHRMLNTLPQLSWIGVNRNGFKLNVLVTERSFASSNRPDYAFGNIVSAKDATITKQIVLEGMKLCAVGDTVKEGQILVSGFEDYGLILKGVCAEAEIYGQTWYTGMLVRPKNTVKKRYTGKQWTQYSLIVGRKRINLCGNSSISGTTCDKMIDEIKLSVPDYEFPIRLEKITYREYEQVPCDADTSVFQQRLREAWQELLASQMIAGKIEHTDVAFSETDDVFVLRCESTCNEMIARLVPMEPVYEGETNE